MKQPFERKYNCHKGDIIYWQINENNVSFHVALFSRGKGV